MTDQELRANREMHLKHFEAQAKEHRSEAIRLKDINESLSRIRKMDSFAFELAATEMRSLLDTPMPQTINTTCAACKGTGSVLMAVSGYRTDCNYCDGNGIIVVQWDGVTHLPPYTLESKCMTCNGMGTYLSPVVAVDVPCKDCNGTGRIVKPWKAGVGG